MAIVNRSVDEIVELETRQKNAKTFVDWLAVTSRAEALKEQFLADLRDFYAVAARGEVAFS